MESRRKLDQDRSVSCVFNLIALNFTKYFVILIIYRSSSKYPQEDLWMQDIPYFEELGVNTLRIYAVDPSKNHDRFMCRLQQAGIYVIVGLLVSVKWLNLLVWLFVCLSAMLVCLSSDRSLAHSLFVKSFFLS